MDGEIELKIRKTMSDIPVIIGRIENGGIVMYNPNSDELIVESEDALYDYLINKLRSMFNTEAYVVRALAMKKVLPQIKELRKIKNEVRYIPIYEMFDVNTIMKYRLMQYKSTIISGPHFIKVKYVNYNNMISPIPDDLVKSVKPDEIYIEFIQDEGKYRIFILDKDRHVYEHVNVFEDGRLCHPFKNITIDDIPDLIPKILELLETYNYDSPANSMWYKEEYEKFITSIVRDL